jgi:hypothetical protein
MLIEVRRGISWIDGDNEMECWSDGVISISDFGFRIADWKIREYGSKRIE